jgi:alpha/beta superfamily hydrolase
MKKLLIGLAVVPFLAGVAMAGQPKPLTDAQMDKVSAGQLNGLIEIEFGTGAAAVELNFFPIGQTGVEFGADGVGHPADIGSLGGWTPITGWGNT